MPVKNRTLTVYPDPTALAIVGGTSPAANRAIECWARVLRQAQPSDLTRDDWNLLADVLNGTILDADWNSQYLLAELADAFDLNGTDWYHFRSVKAATKQKASRHPRGEALLKNIAALDYAGIHAVLTAVAWFWDHCDEFDARRDEWWTPAFRVRFEQPDKK